MGGRCPYSNALLGVATWIWSRQRVEFLRRFYWAFYPWILFASMWCIHIAWKKSRFIFSNRSDFHMITIPAFKTFARSMLTSFSVDEMSLPRYVNVSIYYRGLPFKTEITSCLKHMNSVLFVFTVRPMPPAAYPRLCCRDSAWAGVSFSMGFDKTIKRSILKKIKSVNFLFCCFSFFCFSIISICITWQHERVRRCAGRLEFNLRWCHTKDSMWHYVGGPPSRRSLGLFWCETRQRVLDSRSRRDRKLAMSETEGQLAVDTGQRRDQSVWDRVQLQWGKTSQDGSAFFVACGNFAKTARQR